MVHASWSYCVLSPEGEIIASRNEHLSLLPASTLKLLTVGYAFEKLGPAFQFRTELAATSTGNDGTLEGDLFILADGDPTLTGRDYQTWASTLDSLGIARVEGNLCISPSPFGPRSAPGGWEWDDLGNYYAPFLSGLSLNENRLKLTFRTGSAPGKPTELISTDPPLIDVEIQNHVLTGPAGSGDRAWVYAAPGNTVIQVHGTLPPGRSSFSINGCLPDPDRSAAHALIQGGLDLSGQIKTGVSPPEKLGVLFTHKSERLKDISRMTLARSINGFAETLLRKSGLESGDNTPEDAASGMLEWLETEALSSGSGWRLADGSGLSRSNLVTTYGMARAAGYFLDQSWADTLLQILPANGKEGTIRRVLPGKPGSIRAKTGTLDGVRGYAGYIMGKSGIAYPFCILLNHHSGGSSRARIMLDPLLEAMTALP